MKQLVPLVLLASLCAACGGSGDPGSSTAGGAGGGAGSPSTTAGQAGMGTTMAGTGGSASGSSMGGASGSAAAGAAGSGGSAGGSSEGGLVIEPSELVFGAVQQTTTEAQTVTIKNTGSAALALGTVELDAAATGTGAFELVMAPDAIAPLAAGAMVEAQVRFHPTAIQLFESRLLIETGSPVMMHPVGLFGLGTKGLEGENEPYLKIVLDTLGYDVDVGGAALLSTTTPLVGTEVAAPLFQAAGAGPIELLPVARYSPQEPIPYGYYVGAAETEVGVISDDQYQQLNPKTDAGSELTFAAPAGSFGIFTTSKTHKTYTEDSKNAANATKHAVRTYPLKDRAGAAIANAYLVCFEEAANGDYQDYVFTLKNVKPAP